MTQVLNEGLIKGPHHEDLLEEALVIEHAKRVKAERVLSQIARAQSASALQLRLLANEYLEAA